MMCSSGSWALPRETPSALFGAVSLDRKLQRPLLGKSRTLPSIPQSPVLSRLAPLPPAAYRDEMPEQKPYKKPSASEHQKGCTVPSAGHLWLVSTGSGGRNIIAALPTALALEICRCSQPSTVLAFGSALRIFVMFFYSHADPDEIRILLGQLV